MNLFKCKRKVQKFGSSYAVTLPSFFVKANEIEKGVKLSIHYNIDGVLIISKFDNIKTKEKLEKIIYQIEPESP
jgi:antitoxin component of MazEF toxin-antitoxin module